MAQNVYSVNVVGYINVPIVGTPTGNGGNGNYTLIANPLDASNGGANAGGNTLSNLFPNAGFADEFLQWNGVNGFNTSTYLGSWSPNFTVAPGAGGFYQTTAGYTNTFAGTVLQGNLTNAVGSGVRVTANQVPVSANVDSNGLSAIMGFGDNVLLWNQTRNSGNGGFDTYTYFGSPGSWSPSAPVVNPGQAVFTEIAAPTGPWVQTFNVQ
jgi:hypothetical protein